MITTTVLLLAACATLLTFFRIRNQRLLHEKVPIQQLISRPVHKAE